MRKIALFAASIVTAAAWLAPASAADEEKVNTYGEVRARAEVLENYFDLDDDDNEDSVSFGSWRASLGLESAFSKNVKGLVEIQGFGTWGGGRTPNVSFADPFGGTVSNPAICPAGVRQSCDEFDVDLDVYQAHITMESIGGSGANLRIGRQEHVIGTELQLGNNDFYNGTSFDGVRLWWEIEGYVPELFFYIIDENDIDENESESTGNFSGGDEDVTLGGIDVDIALAEDGQHIQPYVLYYRDGDFFGGHVWTVGAQYGRPAPREASGFSVDWNAEAAIQLGDFSPNGVDFSYGGSIFEFWVGFNFAHGDRGHSRVHVGGLMASGDDDLGDDDFDYFVPMFPDNHAHGRTGNLDLFSGATFNNTVDVFVSGFGLAGEGGLSNITDYVVGYGYRRGPHDVMATAHMLSLTEDGIHRSVFLTTDDEVGLELDLVYGFDYSANLGFQVGAAQLSTGGLLEQLFGSDIDDIKRLWAQAKLSWD